MCPKIADIGDIWHIFAILKCFRGLWMAEILVEDVLSYKISTQTSKLDKN